MFRALFICIAGVLLQFLLNCMIKSRSNLWILAISFLANILYTRHPNHTFRPVSAY
jgi:1,4-dihydroxy-2-naphthoate octaprenyltransferase